MEIFCTGEVYEAEFDARIPVTPRDHRPPTPSPYRYRHGLIRRVVAGAGNRGVYRFVGRDGRLVAFRSDFG
ncbi:hypothetical protein GCM10009835_13090 [Planosporangium flavigriseum]|uniref:Uncharacterized protein n=1 Tax=Planosporangium flavigriseum TaxID=373681 RepID=A0A8J3LW59_9ACTN|nr:hypothetical protein Pfl04_33230 [Planosporangium flavigriseum]